ncbi:MAG: DUF1003 domain-containing protein [Gemmatimonadota bacterium]
MHRPGQGQPTQDVEQLADELVRRNVTTIAGLEQAARRQRTFTDRIVDGITHFCANIRFVYLHGTVYGLWILVNLSPFDALRFDPYPFGLLTMVGSIEALFLATFILITQNRQMQLADRRHHLDLQVSLLAEQEITKVLELVEELHAAAGLVKADAEIEALKQATHPERVVEQIQEYVERPAHEEPAVSKEG